MSGIVGYHRLKPIAGCVSRCLCTLVLSCKHALEEPSHILQSAHRAIEHRLSSLVLINMHRSHACMLSIFGWLLQPFSRHPPLGFSLFTITLLINLLIPLKRAGRTGIPAS